MRTEGKRARERELYSINRDRILARKKAWREKNKEAVSKHNKEHYNSHPEFHKAIREKRKAERDKWRKYGRDYYAMNREEKIAYGKKWVKENPEKYKRSYRASRLKRKYGLTIEQYEAIVESQDGKCLACHKVPSGKAHSSRLHLDHCHTTGRLRGMLCYQCNLALGLVRDDITVLQGLIAHLKRNQDD